MFKVGDKVKIIKPHEGQFLTVGKVYDVIEKGGIIPTPTKETGFAVQNDLGSSIWILNFRGEKVTEEHPKEIKTYEASDGERFEDLDEAREYQKELDKPKLDLSKIYVEVVGNEAVVRLGTGTADRVLSIIEDGTFYRSKFVKSPVVKDQIKEREYV